MSSDSVTYAALCHIMPLFKYINGLKISFLNKKQGDNMKIYFIILNLRKIKKIHT